MASESEASAREQAREWVHRMWRTRAARRKELLPPSEEGVLCWGCGCPRGLVIHHLLSNGHFHRWHYRGNVIGYYDSITDLCRDTFGGTIPKEISWRLDQVCALYVVLCKWCHSVIHTEKITLCQDTFPFGALVVAATSGGFRQGLQKLNQNTQTPSRRGRKRTTKR